MVLYISQLISLDLMLWCLNILNKAIDVITFESYIDSASYQINYNKINKLKHYS